MDGLATPSLAGIITAIASVLTAISLILVAIFPLLKLSRESRTNSEKLDDVHVLVNGNLSRERERNEQLVAELQRHGIPIPPRERHGWQNSRTDHSLQTFPQQSSSTTPGKPPADLPTELKKVKSTSPPMAQPPQSEATPETE